MAWSCDLPATFHITPGASDRLNLNNPAQFSRLVNHEVAYIAVRMALPRPKFIDFPINCAPIINQRGRAGTLTGLP